MLPTTITQVALVALRGGCFAVLRIVVALGRMLCRLGCLFRRMLCRQGRTSWVDAWPPSCYWCLLCGCFAAQVVIGGCFATVWKASSVMATLELNLHKGYTITEEAFQTVAKHPPITT